MLFASFANNAADIATLHIEYQSATQAVVCEAATRNKPEYKKEAIKPIGQIALQYPAFVDMPAIQSVVDSILVSKSATDDDEKQDTPMTDAEEEYKTMRTDPSMLADIYQLIGDVWPRSSFNPFTDGNITESMLQDLSSPAGV